MIGEGLVRHVCPECGYNAGEDGEKILQLHMLSEHGAGAGSATPEQLAMWRRESEVMLSRTILAFGGIALLLGLGLTAYGASNYAILNCPLTSSACFIPQYLVDQIRTNGFRAVFVGFQETAYGGLLLVTLGSMGIAFWGARRLELAQRVTLVLLVGVFLLVLVTALAIASGFIPFGERIVFRQ